MTRPLFMALTLRDQSGGSVRGAASIGMRRGIIENTPASARAHDEQERLYKITKHNMPPKSEDVRLLIDTLAFHIGSVTRFEAWEHIGIDRRRGEHMIGRGSHLVDWPVWFTLRETALVSEMRTHMEMLQGKPQQPKY